MGNSLSTQDVVTDRDIILQEAREREEYRLKLLNEVIKATTYKKGEINKEVVRLPMPTSNKVIANKKINLKTYGSIMLHSKWGGTFLNEDNRYIYNDYINEKCEEIAKDCQISKRTLKSHIAKLKKCDIKIFEPMIVGSDLVYRLNYSVEGQEYITINSVALRKLCNAYSENALKLYLIFSYSCIDVEKNKDSKSYKVKQVEKLITQKWLCEKLGISYNNRIVITDCVNALKKGGFIKVRQEYKLSASNKNKVVNMHKKPEFYYSLSEDYLID